MARHGEPLLFYTHAQRKETTRVRTERAVVDGGQRSRTLRSSLGFKVLRRAGLRVPFETPLGKQFEPTGLTSVVVGDIETGYEVSLLIWGHLAIVLLVFGYLIGKGF